MRIDTVYIKYLQQCWHTVNSPPNIPTAESKSVLHIVGAPVRGHLVVLSGKGATAQGEAGLRAEARGEEHFHQNEEQMTMP